VAQAWWRIGMFSLKYRIAFTIFLLESLMMAVVLWQTLSHAVDSTRSQIHAVESVTLGLVGEVARNALLTEEYDMVQPYIEKLRLNPNIRRAFVVDDRDVIVASEQFGDLGEPLPVLKDTAATYWRIQPIANPAGTLGRLAVEFSTDPLAEAYRQALNLGIVIAAAGMGIIALVGVTFGFFLTRRLKRLVDAAGKLAEGDFSVRTRFQGRDEVARLGAAFDAMAHDIAADREQLARINEELEARVEARTRDLADANQEYQAFAYSVSHDLRAPLRGLTGFSQVLLDDYGEQLDETARDYLRRIQRASQRMSRLIDGLLKLSRLGRSEIECSPLDLSRMAAEILRELADADSGRNVQTVVEPGVTGSGDPRLVRDVLQNLLGNAWKFTSKTDRARIEFGSRQEGQETVYFVRDNGAGFDQAYAHKLFTPFLRLHANEEFEGDGIGLSTVQRIIHRHGGRVWGEGQLGKGASFYFTLGSFMPPA
jgi:signal transduction histidine kinase